MATGYEAQKVTLGWPDGWEWLLRSWRWWFFRRSCSSTEDIRLGACLGVTVDKVKSCFGRISFLNLVNGFHFIVFFVLYSGPWNKLLEAWYIAKLYQNLMQPLLKHYPWWRMLSRIEWAFNKWVSPGVDVINKLQSTPIGSNLPHYLNFSTKICSRNQTNVVTNARHQSSDHCAISSFTYYSPVEIAAFDLWHFDFVRSRDRGHRRVEGEGQLRVVRRRRAHLDVNCEKFLDLFLCFLFHF